MKDFFHGASPNTAEDNEMINYRVFKTRDEWLEARADTIGGSEASSIVGMNPYKDNIKLWREKTGLDVPQDISEKSYVKYGTEAEKYLIELFKLDFPEYQVRTAENNMFTNEQYPFAHASLDGWILDQNGNKGILEIKTTNIVQSYQKEKWKDRIPDNYYIQCLHYLMVTGYDFVILKAQLKSDFNGDITLQTKHYRIDREDVKEDIKFLEEAEMKFWEQVKNKKKPDLMLPQI